MIKDIKESVRKIFFPLPQDQKEQGFKPNLYIISLRRLAKMVIILLRLNGKNRFSNEFIQMLDPKIAIDLPNNEKIIFRTGHGRLLWRARTLLSEEPMMIDWLNRFDADDCFYDVGANVGNYSLYAAKRGIKTFAFEPELNNLSLLYENIFLNRVEKMCTPVPIALSDSTNLDVFYLKSISKGDALHSISRKSYLLNNSSSNTHRLGALCMKLDDLVCTFNLPRPTKLKIDVDYNELKVIKGAAKTLDSVKELYIELDHKLTEHREVLEILKNKSFHVIEKEDISKKWSPPMSNYILRRAE